MNLTFNVFNFNLNLLCGNVQRAYLPKKKNKFYITF